jgi:hypothetical protein
LPQVPPNSLRSMGRERRTGLAGADNDGVELVAHEVAS